MSKRRCLRVPLIRTAGAPLRTAVFEEREHLVVPVVALVEGVIHAVNSDYPELVLAEEFSKAPEGWNGRPVMPNHPEAIGGKISANDPRVLELQSFGRVFHTSVKDKKLCMEAWLDKAKAEKIGGEALRAVERVKDGETVEISVGVYVMTDEKPGTYNGKRYAAIWREIVPDHLAMLPEDTTGACSVEMGCGAPRMAEAALRAAFSFKEETVEKSKFLTKLKEQGSEFIGDLLGLMQFRENASQDMTDYDIRNALDKALRAMEPGYLGIDALLPEAAEVVYACAPDQSIHIWKRGYMMAKDGSVTFGEEKEEVRPVTRFEPVAASGNPTDPPAEKKSGCGCGGNGEARAASAAEGEERPMAEVSKEQKDRVAALLRRLKARDPRSVKDGDQEIMEAWSSDQLDTIEQELDKSVQTRIHALLGIKKAEGATDGAAATTDGADKGKGTTAPAATTEPAKEKTEEEFLAEAPQSIKDAVEQTRAAAAAKKAELLKTLKGVKQDAYTQAELDAMDVPALEKVVKLLGAAAAPKPTKKDFGPQASSSRAAQGEEDESAPPAPSMRDRLLARAGKGKETAA